MTILDILITLYLHYSAILLMILKQNTVYLIAQKIKTKYTSFMTNNATTLVYKRY